MWDQIARDRHRNSQPPPRRPQRADSFTPPDTPPRRTTYQESSHRPSRGQRQRADSYRQHSPERNAPSGDRTYEERVPSWVSEQADGVDGGHSKSKGKQPKSDQRHERPQPAQSHREQAKPARKATEPDSNEFERMMNLRANGREQLRAEAARQHQAGQAPSSGHREAGTPAPKPAHDKTPPAKAEGGDGGGGDIFLQRGAAREAMRKKAAEERDAAEAAKAAGKTQPSESRKVAEERQRKAEAEETKRRAAETQRKADAEAQRRKEADTAQKARKREVEWTARRTHKRALKSRLTPAQIDAQGFDEYERVLVGFEAWDKKPNEAKGLLTFDMVPWPVLEPKGTIVPEDMTSKNVMRFFDMKQFKLGNGYRKFWMKSQQRFQVDAWARRWSHVSPDEVEMIKRALGEVSKAINEVKP